MSRLRTALAVLACTVVGGAVVLLVSGRADGGHRYAAHFTNARGLVPDTDVRVGGAIAGRVREVRLADDGTAIVRFTLDDDRVRPRADAAAAIRPVDLLGDTYLSLSPGRSRQALDGAIPAARTSNSPRLDELLSVFRAPVRDALQTLLVEAGLALDARGTDLTATAVALRPALQAAERVAGELDAQNRALARAVVSADRALGQVAAGADDVGPLTDGLARTVAATATRKLDLGRGLAAMPPTLGTLRRTATRLAAAAQAATPLAAALRRTAPSLADAVAGLAPLLTRVRSAAGDLRPAVRSLTQVLTRGAPTIEALDAGLERVRATAPQTAPLIDALVPAAPQIAEGFLVDFPDQAQEPGTQPGDPFADPRRAYWRGAAVFSCEAFGVPVRPGCLTDVLPPARGASPKTAATSAAGSTGGGRPVPAPTPGIALGGGGGAGPVTKLTGTLQDLRPAAAPAANGTRRSVGDLLDFLLGR